MNDTIPDGSYTVTDDEIQDYQWVTQVELHILKDAGAPVVGAMRLEMDVRYHWFLEPDKLARSYKYSWKFKEG